MFAIIDEHIQVVDVIIKDSREGLYRIYHIDILMEETMVTGEYISIKTQGFSDIRDISEEVQGIVSRSKIKNGLVNIFVVGSTASVTTIEYEPALVEDVKEHLEKFASSSMRSRHSQTWGDDNGFSHIRATFMGPGLTAPVHNGSLVLGTWQQIVVIDHDNRPRSRKVFVQVLGE
jgi:secondary thiamine-phosphate synthase enzyme